MDMYPETSLLLKRGDRQEIVLCCRNEVLDDLKEYFHNEVQVEKQLKERTTVRLMAQSEAVEAFVRGKLTTVEVIEPKQLRFSIIARLREALDQYEA